MLVVRTWSACSCASFAWLPWSWVRGSKSRISSTSFCRGRSFAVEKAESTSTLQPQARPCAARMAHSPRLLIASATSSSTPSRYSAYERGLAMYSWIRAHTPTDDVQPFGGQDTKDAQLCSRLALCWTSPVVVQQAAGSSCRATGSGDERAQWLAAALSGTSPFVSLRVAGAVSCAVRCFKEIGHLDR